MLRPLTYALLRLRNRLDYPLRQFFHWRRKGLRRLPRPASSLDGLFDDLPPDRRARAQALAERLLNEYHLQSLSASAAPGVYRENLYYLDLLETALERCGASLPDPLTAADIGPSHWFYVQALYALLRWRRSPQGRDVSLTGYEADAYRVYTDLHSRYDHAVAHMAGLPGVSYIPRAFSPQEGSLDLAFMLFPFVFELDHLQWGLPASLFQPLRLLDDAWRSLKPGGALIIVNQGPEEHRAQQKLLASLGIAPAAAYCHDPLLFTYAYDRYVLAAIHAG